MAHKRFEGKPRPFIKQKNSWGLTRLYRKAMRFLELLEDWTLEQSMRTRWTLTSHYFNLQKVCSCTVGRQKKSYEHTHYSCITHQEWNSNTEDSKIDKTLLKTHAVVYWFIKPGSKEICSIGLYLATF